MGVVTVPEGRASSWRQPPGLAEGTPSRLPTSLSPFHGPQSLLKSRERRVVLAVPGARGMDYALVPQSVHLGVSQPWAAVKSVKSALGSNSSLARSQL